MFADLNDNGKQAREAREAWLLKWIPRAALFISICAFIFQTTVLYPWHLELSEQIKTLSRQVRNIPK